MHILGQCTFDLIRDDCFQEGPSNLTVLANFEREEETTQIAHLKELYATYSYGPGPVVSICQYEPFYFKFVINYCAK